MLRGQVEEAIKFFWAIALVSVIMLLVTSDFVSVSVVEESALQKLKAVDTAHVVEQCIAENGIVTVTALESTLQELPEKCGIRGNVAVAVWDLREPGLVWRTPEDREGEEHRITIVLENEEGDRHVGQLQVTI
ncbi:MAG: hypothetical protein HY520_00730 [Candidatus Aenigmarchaeota archaeon]|nr:hypothetical protein [Candidatus Aenigmarchaeota archaeon]